jgi:hypothetical protein
VANAGKTYKILFGKAKGGEHLRDLNVDGTLFKYI